MFYLHRTTTKLVIQLGTEERTSPDLILTGVHSLPGNNITVSNDLIIITKIQGFHLFDHDGKDNFQTRA